MNHKGVCRTVSATPGLLIIRTIIIKMKMKMIMKMKKNIRMVIIVLNMTLYFLNIIVFVPNMVG